MSSKEVSGLTAAAALAGADLVPISQGGNSRKATLTQIRTFARTGLVIGTDVQAWDADLDALAELVGVRGDIIYRNATQWQRLSAGTAGQVLKTGGAGADPSWAGLRESAVKKAADQNTADYSTDLPIAWDTEVSDTDNFHSKTSTVTITIATPGVITWTAHGLAAGCPIVFSTTGALPTGLTAGTTYYVLAPTTDTFTVAATVGGAAIATSGTQSGVQTGTTRNTAFVVPVTVNHVRIGFNLYLSSVTSSSAIRAYLKKNGTEIFTGALGTSQTAPSAGVPNVSAISRAIPVSAGDAFEIWLFCSDNSISVVASVSHFWIEIVD